MGKMKNTIPESHDFAYASGYLQGLLDACWTCMDCGNVYSPDVEACPNINVDEASAKVRGYGASL